MDKIEEARRTLEELDKKAETLRNKVEKDELDKIHASIREREAEIEGLETKLEKPKREPVKFRAPRISARTRKVAVSLVVFSVVCASLFFFVNRVVAAAPTIVYADPDDDSLFADTNDGDGVTWVINVSDADTDIQEVELWANSSGTWVKFYDSGALGGVAYHNTSDQNGNWTGSWTKYWWNISVNDGTWHNTTYSFTTAYQWGDPQMAVLDDAVTFHTSVVWKNATGDYFLWHEGGGTGIDVKTSDTGTNWSLEPKSADIASGSDISSGFTYNNQPYVLYKSGNYLRYATWDGSSWSSGDTNIRQYYSAVSYAYGADCIYYNGLWNIVAARSINSNPWTYTAHYTGTFPSSWTKITDLDTGDQHDHQLWSFPSLASHNGTLHCVYKDTGYDLYWRTYDGATWTDRGAIGGDALNLGGATETASQYYQGSLVKDPVNQQLVVVYINTSGALVYRITDNLTSWSDSHLILSKGSYDIRYPHVEYIDHSFVITISYNLRGNYNIYTIRSPGYSSRPSGVNYTLNRIQWPDASPGDTNVNSTVFSLKNLNNRDIKTITWHFEDIGEITAASNLKLWTNMSGGWNGWTCDASGNVSTLDISGEMAGGAEWIPGQTIWWKVEIIAVGSVSEDIHTTDEDIFYKITF